MKFEIEEEMEKLNRDEINIRAGIENHDSQIDDCLDVLTNLDRYYVAKNTEVKQRIIGSMFPEKLYFENGQYRTTKVNEAVSIFTSDSKVFESIKKEKGLQITNPSLGVDPERFELSSKQGIQKLSTRLAQI
jgi:hypothetical protein